MKGSPALRLGRKQKMNCLCNLRDNDIVWIILIALLVANVCNTAGNSCGGNGDCGCYGRG